MTYRNVGREGKYVEAKILSRVRLTSKINILSRQSVHSHSIIAHPRMRSWEGESDGLSGSSSCLYLLVILLNLTSPNHHLSPELRHWVPIGPANDIFPIVPNRVKYRTVDPRTAQGVKGAKTPLKISV